MRYSHLFHGEQFDARLDDTTWDQVRYRLIPRPSNYIWGIFYGDAHILVKHRVFDRYLPHNTGLAHTIDWVK